MFFQELWEYMSHFITIEEIYFTIVLTVISAVYIITAWLFDKYDKKIDQEIKRK